MSTVRSAARARNRPYRALAWILVATLSGLIALTAQAAADCAPTRSADSIDDDEAIAATWPDDRVPGALEDETTDDRALRAFDDDELSALGVDALSALGEPTLAASGEAASASPLGRFEVALAWRRRDALDERAASERRVDELWLVAAWSR